MPLNNTHIARFTALINALRLRQWTKNGAVFIGILFSQHLFDWLALERAIIAFVTFCFASSSIYLLNDLLDLEKDRQHPVKRLRPLAAGRLPASWAIVTMGMLVLASVGMILVLYTLPFPRQPDIFASLGGANLLFAIIIASYLLLMVAYGLRLKHVVLIDVFIIAGGFVLRIMAGAVAIPVFISPWLYLVTIFLALFLALSKRRHELTLLQGQASSHRQILKEYSIPLLDQLITITVTATLIAYSLYTIQGPTGNHRLVVTIPLVLYGIFRYLYLVYMRGQGGSPEEVLLRDRHMLGTVLLCTILIIGILYVM
ncbi:MAG: decaprenyl-phosphate phosphoribosyltransferase [Ktedonobacteraceae bacterium]|nr:decaprenyl-phosphate phosphoribosyltransferase [Ktedonobacteraceae bacterium]